MTQVQLSSLRIGRALAEGGQGVVHELIDRPDQVLKRYHHPGHPQFQASALANLVHDRTAIRNAGRSVDEFAAWPAEVVLDETRTIGFLMRRVPDRFQIAMGGRPRLADLSYLATAPKPLWGPISLPSHADKLRILRDLAGVMDALHARNIVLGDISFANVLWTLQPAPQIMLLDCDGMCWEGEPSVLPQADTLDWDDPNTPHGVPPTRDQDRYKFALAVIRVLGTSLSARLDAIPDRGLLGPNGMTVHDLLRRAAGPAGTRPPAAEWVAALSDRQTQPILPATAWPSIDMPRPQPGMFGDPGPRQFRPIQPPQR